MLTEEQFKMLCFEHEGVAIHNPFMSPCGRFIADPCEDYGFQEWGMGGGCQALVKEFYVGDDKRFLIVTDLSGINLPGPDAAPYDILVGVQDFDGEELATATLAEIISAFEGA